MKSSGLFYNLKSALIGIAVPAFLSISGCVQMTPVPSYARAGDTITLGLGGIQRNAQGNQNLSYTDLQVVITDSAQHTFTVPINNIFKAYPDYSSYLNYRTINNSVPVAPATPGGASLPLRPFDGGWFVVATLIDNQGNPLPLTPGSATVSVTSPTGKLLNVQSKIFDYYNEGDLTKIPLEILSGTTTVPADTSQFMAYTSIDSLPVIKSQNLNVNSVGGVQLVIRYPNVKYNSAYPPLVVPLSHNPAIQLAQNVVVNSPDANTNTLNILLTSAQGFNAPGNAVNTAPLLSDLNLRILFYGASGQNPNPITDFQIDMTKSRYIDMNGATITGATPIVGRLQ